MTMLSNKNRPKGGFFHCFVFSFFSREKGVPRLRARVTLLLFASGGLFSFSSERKEEKKRRQKLRFWISLRGFTCSLSCSLSATRTLFRIDFAKILHCLCFLERCRFCSEIQAHQLLPWLKSAAAAQTRRQSFYPHDKAKSPRPCGKSCR